MKGKKNDYSLVFYKRPPEESGGQHCRVYQLNYVHDTTKAISWLNKKQIDWDYVNIYERRSRAFISRIYN